MQLKTLISTEVALCGLLFTQIAAFGQGTAFTYQGRLNDGTNAATGIYDLTFTLFTVPSGGSAAAGPLTKAGVGVTNGLFTVALDYGTGLFNGTAYYLEINARTNGAASFTTLSPRQQLTPTPYAIYGENAGTANAVVNGAVSSSQLNTPSGPSVGQILEYNGSSMAWADPGTAFSGWSLTGNVGTTAGTDFVGTTDNQPLELHVNGLRALRLELTGNTPNVVGGYYSNAILNAAVGATIGGGGAADGHPNFISSTLGTIAGGSGNTIGTNANDTTIAGGRQNKISDGGWGGFIGGGYGNVINPNAQYATIGGGYLNSVNTNFATIAGGRQNTAYGQFATVGGGGGYLGFNPPFPNAASGDWSVVAGGDSNGASAPNSVVSGGSRNTASGQYATVAGGFLNQAKGIASFTAGQAAYALSDHAFVWGDGSANIYDNGANTFNVLSSRGMVLTVSGSSGLNPAAFYVNSTSANGVGAYINEASSDAAFVVNNTASGGGGDIMKGFNGGGSPVFEVVNDGTVYCQALTITSDRNAKEHFTTVDPQAVLAKVAALPVSEWNYKTDPADEKHVGPMAQDFQAAFGLNGADDKHISVVDEGGVALAAIKGLNDKLESDNASLHAENADLKQQLETLKQQVNQMQQKLNGGYK